MTHATPPHVSAIPKTWINDSGSPMSAQAISTVSTGLIVNSSSTRRAPMRLSPAKNSVSPSPMPITPLSAISASRPHDIVQGGFLKTSQSTPSTAERITTAISPLVMFSMTGGMMRPTRRYSTTDTAQNIAATVAAIRPQVAYGLAEASNTAEMIRRFARSRSSVNRVR